MGRASQRRERWRRKVAAKTAQAAAAAAAAAVPSTSQQQEPSSPKREAAATENKVQEVGELSGRLYGYGGQLSDLPKQELVPSTISQTTIHNPIASIPKDPLFANLPKMADPFEVRMRFTNHLRSLNASVTSAQKATQYALKYREQAEDLHSCILEQLERSNMNIRANIMYFIEHFLDTANREGHGEYVVMMARDIIRVVDAVAPEDGSGAANVKVARKVITALHDKKFLDDETVSQISEVLRDRYQTAQDLAITSSFSPSDGELPLDDLTHMPPPRTRISSSSKKGPPKLDRKQVEQRIEEDRERHKRQRENTWAVAPENEFERLWDETSSLGSDDERMAKEEYDEWKEQALPRGFSGRSPGRESYRPRGSGGGELDSERLEKWRSEKNTKWNSDDSTGGRGGSAEEMRERRREEKKKKEEREEFLRKQKEWQRWWEAQEKKEEEEKRKKEEREAETTRKVKSVQQKINQRYCVQKEKKEKEGEEEEKRKEEERVAEMIRKAQSVQQRLNQEYQEEKERKEKERKEKERKEKERKEERE
ncbi:CTD kinase subunit gamma CTK3-domain-containing protein [Podospora australis]|uniref:CTD kinase subunit gamma CTK3-domain-containing protein n=1 Tax=Podospora australis TaxID=1536484 RepID=A0AAN6X4N1_9PEZI|nr:CTD kinase subunit gamma CTK3-domain-containing protein [Podospora australis]